MRTRLALATTALLLTAACSSQPPGQAAGPASSPSPSMDCETASQDEWARYCLPTSSPQPTEQVPFAFGVPFDYASVNSDGPETSWEITLTEMKCGLKRLSKAAANPKWQGEDDVPQMIDAVAEDGSEWCRARWTWKNVGKAPGYIGEAGDVMLGDERFGKQSEDSTYSIELTTQANDSTDTEVNPRATANTVDVWTVPAGSVASAAWFPSTTLVESSYLLVSAS